MAGRAIDRDYMTVHTVTHRADLCILGFPGL